MEMTYEEAWATGQPLPDFICAVCDKPFSHNCKETHTHSGWMDCVNVFDVRKLWCGCYGHKECTKSGPPDNDEWGGNHCREHGTSSPCI